MSFTKPIGVAYLDQDIIGADTVSANVVYATSQLGYTNGAYGTVTQTGNKASAVTLNKTAGTITTTNAQMAPGAKVAFVVNNSQVSALDTIIVNIASGATATFAYLIAVVTVTDGAFTINLDNVSSNAYTDTLKINFAILHVQPAKGRIMPLKKSTTPEAFRKNVKAEVAAGKPVKQAVAIAYSVKRAAAAPKGKK